MAYFYSPSAGAFYPDQLRPDYEAAGTWPADAVAVDDTTYDEFAGQAPDGKARGAAADGSPAWVDVPTRSVAERLADLATLRYARETAGYWFKPAGAATAYLVATDRESQGRIAAAVLGVIVGSWIDGTPWKCADGSFVPLTAAEVRDMAVQVGNFVQTCYATEYHFAQQITSGASPDTSVGWPSQGPH